MKRVVVDPLTQCWNFTGARNPQGYGLIGIATGRCTTAHRVSYQLFVGPIPTGHEIHHVCENKPCVNPAHLQPVTRRQHQAVTPKSLVNRTHCPQGHLLSGENLIRLTRKARQCRECNRIRSRREYAADKEKKREYAAAHREQINAGQKARYAKDPARYREYTRRYLVRKRSGLLTQP